MGTTTSQFLRVNNRRVSGGFVLLPYAVMDSDAFLSLSNKAIRCLLDMLRQFNGGNNGDLSCTLKIMKRRKWNSKSHLDKARLELLEKGLIVLTRLGGRNKCNLYAVTWFPIHECNGKLDRKPTKIPLGYWKKGINPEVQKVGDKLIYLTCIAA